MYTVETSHGFLNGFQGWSHTNRNRGANTTATATLNRKSPALESVELVPLERLRFWPERPARETLLLIDAFAAPSRDEAGCRAVMAARRTFRTGLGVTARTAFRRVVRTGWITFLYENKPTSRSVERLDGRPGSLKVAGVWDEGLGCRMPTRRVLGPQAGELSVSLSRANSDRSKGETARARELPGGL